jgi:hypothetical protein
MITKKCIKCLKEKIADEFAFQQRAINNLSSYCLECKREHSRQIYLKTRQKRMEEKKELAMNKYLKRLEGHP